MKKIGEHGLAMLQTSIADTAHSHDGLIVSIFMVTIGTCNMPIYKQPSRGGGGERAPAARYNSCELKKTETPDERRRRPALARGWS